MQVSADGSLVQQKQMPTVRSSKVLGLHGPATNHGGPSQSQRFLEGVVKWNEEGKLILLKLWKDVVQRMQLKHVFHVSVC